VRCNTAINKNPGYKNLLAWQIADQLAQEVYKTTLQFPKEEIYGLTSQIRRASISIPLNIIEGYSRNNKNEFRQFLRIALGSLAETGYLLEFSFIQKYLSLEEFDQLRKLKNRCGSLLWKLFKSQS
jgi:four helix bundle protein